MPSRVALSETACRPRPNARAKARIEIPDICSWTSRASACGVQVILRAALTWLDDFTVAWGKERLIYDPESVGNAITYKLVILTI